MEVTDIYEHSSLLRCGTYYYGNKFYGTGPLGRIFSCVRPFFQQAVSDLGPLRSMHRPVLVAHNSFIKGSHTTKNTASRVATSILFVA